MIPQLARSHQDDVSDLTALALNVRTSHHHASMSSRTVAQCLSGVIGLVAQRYGVRVMQSTCVEFARSDRLQAVAGHDGLVPEAALLIMVVVRGLVPVAGDLAVRSALSYWATESDPAAWMGLAPSDEARQLR